jgi:phospholipid/cholesterol/gamma-HCH transport system substrate-binding protein
MKDSVAFKVGAAAFVMLCVLSALIIWKSGVLFRANGYELIGEFPSVNGLVPGAEVRFRGMRIGKVFTINPMPDRVEVHFRVLDSVKVPRGSTLKVYFDGLIGEKFLNIVPSEQYDDILKPGEKLVGVTAPALAEFIDIGAKNLEITREVLAAYRDVLNSTEVLQAVKNTVLSVEQITKDVEGITEALGGNATRTSIQTAIKNLSDTSAIIKERSDSLLNDPRLNASIQSLSNTTARIDAMTARLDTEVLTPESTKAIAQTLQDVSVIARQLRLLLEGQPDAGKGGLLQTMSTFSRVKFRPVGQGYYLPEQQELGGRAQLDLVVDQQYVRMGFDALRYQDGPSYHLQHGMWFGPLGARYGLVHSHVGVGVDYAFSERTRVGVDVYNLEQLEADFRASAMLLGGWDLLFLLKRDPVTKDYDRYGFGLQIGF